MGVGSIGRQVNGLIGFVWTMSGGAQAAKRDAEDAFATAPQMRKTIC
jgi:hypothetical protein